MSLECRPGSRKLPTAPTPEEAESTGPSPLHASPKHVELEHDTTTAAATLAPTKLSLSPASTSTTLFFRVTGAAAVARLEPLLLNRPWQGGGVRWSPARTEAETVGVGPHGNRNGRAGVLDFVWETTVTKDRRRQHRSARVLNRLSGAQVLEDKANLAHLQRLMTIPTLESYVVTGRVEVERWADLRFRPATIRPPRLPEIQENTKWQSLDGHEARGGWWCVKASGGNGGMDVWVVHEGNWRGVVERLHEAEEYVIQRYVERPLLWRGRKFHFRCYATISADMSAWLYRSAYILCASRPYTLGDGRMEEMGLADELVHISNLAVNKRTKGHPGQIPCDIPSEYPLLWPGMLELLRSLVEAAAPFMEHQASVEHFEFLGLDIIADVTGGVWLIEVNRLPGLESSVQNLAQENSMYNSMMMDLVHLVVLPPLIGCPREPGLFEAAAGHSPHAQAPSTQVWRNVMRFAAFKRVSRRRPLPG